MGRKWRLKLDLQPVSFGACSWIHAEMCASKLITRCSTPLPFKCTITPPRRLCRSTSRIGSWSYGLLVHCGCVVLRYSISPRAVNVIYHIHTTTRSFPNIDVLYLCIVVIVVASQTFLFYNLIKSLWIVSLCCFDCDCCSWRDSLKLSWLTRWMRSMSMLSVTLDCGLFAPFLPAVNRMNDERVAIKRYEHTVSLTWLDLISFKKDHINVVPLPNFKLPALFSNWSRAVALHYAMLPYILTCTSSEKLVFEVSLSSVLVKTKEMSASVRDRHMIKPFSCVLMYVHAQWALISFKLAQ